jgi:hypothetical protein
MAYVKVAKKEGLTCSGAINYAANPDKAEYNSGINCSDDPTTAIYEFENTKEHYGKTGGRQYKHFIQSFMPGEITPYKAHEIGRDFADNNFKGYEVYIGTHIDKGHIHNHFIVNSVNFETGEKYHKPESYLQELRQESDKICEREGLSVIKAKEPEQGTIRSADMNKYQLLQRVDNGEQVKSYVLDTAIAVQKAADISINREQFISEMKNEGYTTNWRDDYKNVTFQDMDGHKVRLSNLEKTFNDNIYTKEGLENEFTRFKENDGGKYMSDKSGGDDRTKDIGYVRSDTKQLDQTTRAKQPDENGIREHAPESESRRIERSIRNVEQGIKRNSDKDAGRDPIEQKQYEYNLEPVLERDFELENYYERIRDDDDRER